MTVVPDHFSRRRLAAWAVFITTLIVGLYVFEHAASWRGVADPDTPMRLMSQAQSERCLTAHGLRVRPAGARSLHVTGPSHIDVTLTFYPTFDQAQAAAESWSRQGAQLVTREGAMGGAMDTVAYRARVALDEHKVSLFSGCVGHQPTRSRA